MRPVHVELPDNELIARAKNNDKQAFTVIFDRYRNKILGYIYRYIGDYQRAEDLTVETFLSAYNSLAGYDERGLFSSWLYKIATNYAKKELRHRSRRPGEVSLEAPTTTDGDSTLGDMMTDERSRPDYDLEEAELKELDYKVISDMKDIYKDVLILCDVEGLSHNEAAKILNTNSPTVGTRLIRARRMLYEILMKHGYKFKES
jgi:RNA polymerase sigma-70 factor (ECF subfamily)